MIYFFLGLLFIDWKARRLSEMMDIIKVGLTKEEADEYIDKGVNYANSDFTINILKESRGPINPEWDVEFGSFQLNAEGVKILRCLACYTLAIATTWKNIEKGWGFPENSPLVFSTLYFKKAALATQIATISDLFFVQNMKIEDLSSEQIDYISNIKFTDEEFKKHITQNAASILPFFREIMAKAKIY